MSKSIQDQTMQKGSKINGSGSRRKKFYGMLLLSILIACLLPVTGTYAATKTKSGSLYNMTIYSGKSMQLSNYMENVGSLSECVESADDTYYSIGNKKVATVSKNGIIKGIAAGKTQITVTFRSFEYSEWKGDFAYVTRKKQINVQVIPDDGSTGREYFDYELSKGSITITGLKKKVTDLVIPKVIDGFPVTRIGASAFEQTKIQSVTCQDNIETVGEGAFCSCSQLKTATLNNTVKKLGDSIFSHSEKLETVKLPENLEAIPAGTFESCYQLKEVNLSNKIKTIGASAFYSCSSLKGIKLPDNIEIYDDFAFGSCPGLEKLVLSNKVKKIGHYAFSSCTSLRSVELLDTGDLSTVTVGKKKKDNIIGQSAFGNCTSLTNVQLPDYLTYMYDSVFYGCNSLVDIKLPEHVTTIGGLAFENCTSLEEIQIPKSVKSMGASCFSNCGKLKSITLPEGLTSIGNAFFCECDALSEITIPDSLVKFGDGVFYGCDSLSKVVVNNDITRKVGDAIFAVTQFDSITKAYVNNITFHLTEDDWKHIDKYNRILTDMGVQDTDSDLEKIRKVHDWLVINVSYSYVQFNKYCDELGEVDTVLDKRFGICGAYSATFKTFIDLLNIECIYVVSDAMDHAWNMVKLDDGCWYHIDVTWDDPGWNDEVWEKGWLQYCNLLCDDAGIKSTGHHDWYNTTPAANGTKYLNYFDHSYRIKF